MSQITYEQNGATRMTTTKQDDYLNRLTAMASRANGASYTPASVFNYSYNSANQRTKDVLNDGSYWVYQYDSLGQVTNGVKYFADGTPVAGQQFGYLFDDIGNRKETQSGGDATGQNLRLANYSANNLNQITQRDVPGYVDVMGASIQPFNNAITVNGQTAYRKQEYFRAQIPANNSASALWTNITVVGGQAVTGNVYVAEEPEHFQYDADGNLTNDGRWSYVWNGENRLIQMTVNTNVGPQYQLKFAYDYQGRRIQKIVLTNGIPAYTNDFVYDGWNLIAVLTSDLRPLTSFVWGTDLSGSQQGAGGVGGLLEVSEISNSQITNCFPAFDGNGNVMALVNAANGTLAAEYDYGPFGELIRQTGPMATANPFRFSTKYDDDESDLLYYGYRYYRPSTGTWLRRDPFLEAGFVCSFGQVVGMDVKPGLNEYGFAVDNAVNVFDVIGGGLFCRCGYNPPVTGLNYHSTIQGDSGVCTCSAANQGATVVRTVTAHCVPRLFTPGCFNCGGGCTVKVTYVCTRGTGPPLGWAYEKGKPVWQYRSYKMIKSCFP